MISCDQLQHLREAYPKGSRVELIFSSLLIMI